MTYNVFSGTLNPTHFTSRELRRPCVRVFQPSAAPVSARAETWRPGAAAVESVRHQARYDQSHVEEHPAAEETDDEDESSEEQRQ